VGQVNFEPELAEMMRTGATATMLLDGQKRLSSECVDEVLRTIDGKVSNGKMTPELALSLVHEIAAFRRIVYRQEQKIQNGRAAERRLVEENERPV
jgi:hypothetical protein